MKRHILLGIATLLVACSSAPQRTILLPRPKPQWYDAIDVDINRDTLTKSKSITVHIGKRVDVVAGKIVGGGKPSIEDERYQRDRVTGKTRKIWGVLFRWKFF